MADSCPHCPAHAASVAPVNARQEHCGFVCILLVSISTLYNWDHYPLSVKRTHRRQRCQLVTVAGGRTHDHTRSLPQQWHKCQWSTDHTDPSSLHGTARASYMYTHRFTQVHCLIRKARGCSDRRSAPLTRGDLLLDSRQWGSLVVRKVSGVSNHHAVLHTWI
jgi:hypothetical protein